MQRKKLLSLPINKERADIPLMQAIVQVKKEYGENKFYTETHYNYCYDAFVDKSTGEKVLIIDMFQPAPQSKFLYRLFMTSKKWFTVYDDGKTSEKSLNWSVGGYYSHYNKFHAFNDRTDKIINDYIKNNEAYINAECSGIEKIKKWQDQIREKRLQNKYNRIKESICKDMLEIRPLPKTFDKWIENVVMADSRYLFYDYNGKNKTTGKCSVCGTEVEIPRVRKGEKISCPHCKAKCTALPRKAFKNTYGFCDERNVIYLQPFKNNRFCARSFYIKWSYSVNETPNKYILEEARKIVEFNYGSLNIHSEYEYDEEYRGGEWRRATYYNSASTTAYIFPDTLNKIFKNRENFKKHHINFNKIARICNPTDYVGLYNAVEKVNFLDNLINNGLTNLAKSFITMFSPRGNSNQAEKYNLSFGSLRKGLSVSKDELPVLQYINPDEKEFSMFNAYKSSGRKINPAELKEYFSISKKLGADEKFMMKILKHSSLYQFIKYFNKLKDEGFFKGSGDGYWNNKYHIFASDYNDYLGFAELLDYNLKDLDILYPKNLEKAHDTANKIISNAEFKKGELPQIARQFKEYQKLFQYKTDDFIIRPPKRHNEIKQEGNQLQHCVATYAQRIALGETIILFIRKTTEPEKPYFTLNLNPNSFEIIQCRGLHNCDYPLEVKSFIDEWVNKKIKPLKENKKCMITAA